jgi:hypothetical protein
MTISKLVARIEKEFDFWTRIYAENIPEIKGTAFEQTQKLESSLENYRNKYRGELQSELGNNFLIERICGMHELNPLRNYFFPLKYRTNFAGIILPFRAEKKVFFSPEIEDNKRALDVFSNRGYNIEKIICYLHNIVEMRDIVVSDEENMNLLLEGKDLI